MMCHLYSTLMFFHLIQELPSPSAPFLGGMGTGLLVTNAPPSHIFNTPCWLGNFALLNLTSFTPPMIHKWTYETNVLLRCTNVKIVTKRSTKKWSFSKTNYGGGEGTKRSINLLLWLRHRNCQHVQTNYVNLKNQT
jgi:hypothetical protein